MKKKTITCATAFGVLVASVPVYAMPMEVKAEINKAIEASNDWVVPEDEWKKVNSIAELENVWDFTEEADVVVLNAYIGSADNTKVEIPRELDGKPVELAQLNGAFNGVTHIRVAEGNDSNKVKLRVSDLSQSNSGFYENGIIEYIDLSGLEVNATNLLEAFRGASSLKYVDLSGWNVSELEDLRSMLRECTSLEYVDLSGWKVKDVSGSALNLYADTPALKHVVYKNIDIKTYKKIKPNVAENGILDMTDLEIEGTSIHGLFRGILASRIIGLETWDTSNVTDFTYLFEDCINLTDLSGIENWNVEKAISMASMFKNCSSLTELDLSNWVTTDALTSTNTTFSGLSQVKTLDLTGFDMTNVTQTPWMFEGCHALEEIKGTETWVLDKVLRTKNMFRNCYNLNTIDLRNLNLASNEDAEGMFTLDENANEEQKKILIITDDESVKNYDFSASNRTPALKLTLDASDGNEFNSGALTRIKERYYVTRLEADNPDQALEADFESFGDPLKYGYNFMGWEAETETPVTGLEKLNMTYRATWELITPALTPDSPNYDVEDDMGVMTPDSPNYDVEDDNVADTDKLPSAPNYDVEDDMGVVEEEERNSTNGVEDLKDLDKELQEKVDSIVAETVIKEGSLSLNVKGEDEDVTHVEGIEITKDGIFVIVDGEKLKFETSLDGLLDLDGARAVRTNESNKYSAIPHENTKDGIKINSKNLENILITSKVSEPFVDVDDSDWFKGDVEEAFNYVFTTGTTATTYSPNNQITRAQFAVMIARALELTPASQDIELKDLEGQWYQNEAQALYEAGIIKGFADGTFGGGKKLTRQQAVAMIGRMLEYTGVDTTVTEDVKFADMDKIGEHALDGVKYLALNGVLVSGENTKFNPYNNLTRAQMAKILVRSLKLTDLY